MGFVERHAYGTSLGCIGRRAFILTFCGVLTALCWAQIFSWLLSWSLFSPFAGGKDTLPPHACIGLECYEVFTCRGFSAVTSHIREPLSTLSGAILFPIGVIASLHGYRFELKLVATYLAILAVVYIACFIGDIIYYESCSAYPVEAIQQALLWPFPFPLRRGAQDMLEKMNFYPKASVDKITAGFATMWMYLGLEAGICVILVYTAYQARMLGMLFERGPVGLGVHYGLGQFDEVLNHEALKKRKEPKSFFVEDGQLPKYDADAEMPLAYHVPHNYGAFTGKAKTLASGPSQDMDQWQDRSEVVDAEIAEAKEGLSKAEQAFDDAKWIESHGKDDVTKEENEAMQHFRGDELYRENYQERRAEDLAFDAADEALANAEAAGMSPQEARSAMARAYQLTLSQHHRRMLEMARARTLHEHYRHAERESHYHEMEEEVSQTVLDATSEFQQAQARMQTAQDAKQSLDADKERLAQQRGWEDAPRDLDEEAAYPEPLTLPPRGFPSGAEMSSPAELGGFTSMASPPPTMPMGSIPQTMVMGPPMGAPLSPSSFGTSGTFGVSANFGSGSFSGAVPSTLPPATRGVAAVPLAIL